MENFFSEVESKVALKTKQKTGAGAKKWNINK